MKKIIVLSVLFAGLLCGNAFAYPAFGSAFGNLMTAEAGGQGNGDFGGGVGIADATSFFGTFTYGLSKYMDGRLHAGMIDAGDGADAELVFGADCKWQFWSVNDQMAKRPFDFAIGGLFEYVSHDAGSAFQLGGFALGSYPLALTGGTKLTPYGRLNLRLEKISWDSPGPGLGGGDESNLEFGLNAGCAWEVGTTTTVYGEFQLDGNDGLFLGIDFNVM